MRIIAGSKRGMKLLSPKTDISRPIIDRVKESLFSVLYKYDLPEGAIAADLFSGVGSLGLESLSRGAEFVTFVEKDHGIASILNKNIEKAGFVRQSKVIRANVFKIGTGLNVDNKKCDLVFIDPPYKATMDVQADSKLGDLLNLLGEQVVDDGIAVVRTELKVSLFDRYGQFQVIERRQWGTMTVTILQKKNE